MAKIKINIKNAQIAEALSLSNIKGKIAKKAEGATAELTKKTPAAKAKAKRPTKKATEKVEAVEVPVEEAPRVRARSRSAFEEGHAPSPAPVDAEEVVPEPPVEEIAIEEAPEVAEVEPPVEETVPAVEDVVEVAEVVEESTPMPEPISIIEEVSSPPVPVEAPKAPAPQRPEYVTPSAPAARAKLGPTGKHIRDLLPTKPVKVEKPVPAVREKRDVPPQPVEDKDTTKAKVGKVKVVDAKTEAELEEEMSRSKKGLKPKFKEYRDIKPLRKKEGQKSFDGRDRQGLRDSDDDSEYRKRRPTKGGRVIEEDATQRPNSLKIRVPIQIKDLAAEMKLKASQLVGKLFMSGVMLTINDFLEDETTIQLLGQEFGCDLQIDTSEEERIRVTDQTIREEIKGCNPESLTLRAPVVAFMGHVDHGKTSLIDAIRSSNRAAGEAGAITQHIGAFRCNTAVGDITVLDTPGHEAFSAMRARGADVTDIVVLVVAGDEGMRQQTLEAIQHAKAAGVTIVVAINKSDKPNFDAENVYRQLSEQGLLPEAWGGSTITVNCSAVTKEGINTLLEMLALQAEVLELRANAQSRARGSVLESQMHKGLGAVTTILVQNGTLRYGDALVFGQTWGHVKTMRDEFGNVLENAGPSTPVEITGLSGLPEAGEEFVVVKDDKEARSIAEARRLGMRERAMTKAARGTMENLVQAAANAIEKKVLHVILRADVQGSLEALKVALEKIESQKATLNVIFAGVGEVSESDVQLAAASKAVIIGFHTAVESHAESLIKQFGVTVRLHDIIYHAIDDVKAIMTGMLDRIAQETETGKALVKATFKSSHAGRIAGCEVTEGTIRRSNHIRVMRNGEVVWKGSITSLKRVKDDVREVAKGLECGIVLNGYNDVLEGDVLEAYEVTYITQEL